jgi:hypothetical protein
MQHGAERDVPQVRRCTVIVDDTIRKHGKRVRIVPEKHAGSLHSNAAPAVRMIHKHKFAPIGVRLFQRRKLSRLGTKGLVGRA